MITALVWFRRDLRLADNEALAHALRHAERVVPVYIHAPEEEGDWAPGAASRWWLYHSLAALSEALSRRGSRLLVRRGPSLAALRTLVRETGATLVCFNRLYEPARLAADHAVERALAAEGVEVHAGLGHLLVEPWQIATGRGDPYRVYTPYARAVRARLALPPLREAPDSLPPPPRLDSVPLQALGLLPRVPWDSGLRSAWQPGEEGARTRLRRLRKILAQYPNRRDFPASDGTTRLSPHLHFGEIAPARVWHAIERSAAGGAADILAGAGTLKRELLWREFAHHVLYHFPHTADAPLDERFARFPWRRAPALLAAWQRGETGIPIVDAGMRELWATGFMHNRVRMIAASLLTKHLRLDWRAGARWFWDTLVDADLANNTLNWQWVAGCGADAAPYFRIFNPVLQGRRFDREAAYLRRWIPELAPLPPSHAHAPWEAPAAVLAAAGLRLGRDYPRPVLDLAEGRAAALAAFRRLRPGSARHGA